MAIDWQKTRVRGSAAVCLAVVTAVVAALSHVVVAGIGGYVTPAGAFDFAGGAVVHVNNLIVLPVFVIAWGLAEVAGRTTRRVAPFTSYLIFALILAAVSVLSHLYPLAACVLAWLVAAGYAWRWCKRHPRQVTDVF